MSAERMNHQKQAFVPRGDRPEVGSALRNADGQPSAFYKRVEKWQPDITGLPTEIRAGGAVRICARLDSGVATHKEPELERSRGNPEARSAGLRCGLFSLGDMDCAKGKASSGRSPG
jgi:hypothetical protein